MNACKSGGGGQDLDRTNSELSAMPARCRCKLPQCDAEAVSGACGRSEAAFTDAHLDAGRHELRVLALGQRGADQLVDHCAAVRVALCEHLGVHLAVAALHQVARLWTGERFKVRGGKGWGGKG